MKIAYFDCGFGAAGDMLIGAMIGAGLPVDEFCQELRKIALPPGSFDVRIKDVIRCTVSAKKFDVLVLPCATDDKEQATGQDSDATGVHQARRSTSASEHEHEHQHDHVTVLRKDDHSHSHEHAHENGHEHEHERHLGEILQIIDSSSIDDKAKQLAAKIFRLLGEAEAKVHGVPVEHIHFHEVGAIDAIVDIVGFAIAYQMLGIEKSYVTPLPVGAGLVKTRHGLFPVPGPAVVTLLANAGIPVATSTIQHECLTPTGAAILCAVAAQSGGMPAMRITSAGYGAGTLDPSGFPNVCRVVIGETTTADLNSQFEKALTPANFESEVIAVLEANLDDSSPQLLSFAMEQLFQAGALDVTVTPVVMKKSRSGHVLSVICAPGDRAKLEEIVLRQTSTLGVRSHLCQRLVAAREWQQVNLGNGDSVRVKLGRDRQGNIVNAQPEYDDCAAYATKYGLPLKQVIAEALANLKGDS